MRRCEPESRVPRGLTALGILLGAVFATGLTTSRVALAGGEPLLAPYAPPEPANTDCAGPGPCPSAGPPSPSPTSGEAEEDRAFAGRLEERLSGRVGIAFELGFGGPKHQPEVGTPIPTARLLIGYRKNVIPSIGYHLRAGPWLGMPVMTWNPADWPPGDPDYVTTWVMGGTMDGLLVIGPFGRFFFGPAFCVDYVRFADTVVRTVDATYHLHNGFSVGGGFDVGGVFGAREQILLYQSLRMTYGPAESMIFLFFGIGYLR